MLSSAYSRLFAITLLAGTSMAARAQAIPTVQRGAEFAPFVQTTIVNPDWAQTRNIGFTAGFDYTRFIPSIVQPSLEFRATRATGHTVNESTYLGGIKLLTTIHNIHPYAVVLAGKGIISFNYYNDGIKGDDSAVYAYGGGAEFYVRPAWKLRAEYTQQHWNLDPNTLTPSALGFGVAYSVPFRNRHAVR
ncbi:MAG TPA: outer membrane beta-barrel protein [Acidobacteriaceae bacterium]|nr:outer membrane beta-barrel protein [Acidobacteriaceae bacterium]